MIRAVVFLLLLAQPAQTLPTPQEWEAAERAIVRLKPAAFKDMPANVRADLERRQCTIPQPDYELEELPPYNVIRGRFTSATSIDIAVLCSKDGVSTILLFRGGATTKVAELAPREDKGFLQGGGGHRINFSRAIGVATPATIRAYHEAFGMGQLPRLDHDGIDDAFVGKWSVIRYWTGGKWLELQGAD